MTPTTSTFTTRSGDQLFEYKWLVDQPKAAVVIVHGFGEHAGRYQLVADHFNEQGYAVFAYDQLGHGQSEGRPAYIENFDVLRDDCDHFIERVRQQTEGLPLFVLAHSMGGLVIAYLAVTKMPKLDGVILSGALLVPGSDISPILVQAAKFLGRFTPRLATQKIASSALSRDTAVVAAYDADPLVYHGGVPARTGAEMLRVMQIVSDGVPRINYPLLIVHGTADIVTNVEGSMQLYARAGSADKQLRLFDEGYHESHNELNKDEVLDLYSDWIAEHLTTSAATSTQTHHKKRGQKSDR